VRIALLALLYPPDFGGGATRAQNIAISLKRDGHEVYVITSEPHYPDGALQRGIKFTVTEEKIEGINIIRLPILAFPHRGILNRLLICISYVLSTIIPFAKLRQMDIVLTTGPYPFIIFSAFIYKIIAQKQFIADVSDILWPEAVKLENSIINYFVQVVGYVLNKAILSISDLLLVYNENALLYIRGKYRYSKRAVVVYNAVDVDKFIYNSHLKYNKNNLELLLKRSLAGNFIVMYHGNIGSYQGIGKIIEAAALVQDKFPEVLFVIVGEGEEKNKVIKLVHDMHLNNVVILGKLERTLIRTIVAESDLGLAPIVSEDPLAIFVGMPSKAAEYFAVGTPILAPKGSFLGSIVSVSSAGFEVNFNDPRDIYEAVKNSYLNIGRHKVMCDSARKLAKKHFSLESVKTALRDSIALTCK
jgi:glycosyltransferase involved in cell wall biosynthesis